MFSAIYPRESVIDIDTVNPTYVYLGLLNVYYLQGVGLVMFHIVVRPKGR